MTINFLYGLQRDIVHFYKLLFFQLSGKPTEVFMMFYWNTESATKTSIGIWMIHRLCTKIEGFLYVILWWHVPDINIWIHYFHTEGFIKFTIFNIYVDISIGWKFDPTIWWEIDAEISVITRGCNSLYIVSVCIKNLKLIT